MANTDIRADSAHANPSRLAALNVEFDPLMEADQLREFYKERQPGINMATQIAFGLACYNRADLRGRVREMDAGDIDGRNALVVTLEMMDDLIDHHEAQLEIFQAIRARVLVVADDLIIEEGLPSIFSGKDTH